MLVAFLVLTRTSLADPLLVGVGTRHVFREEAPALTLTVAPSWGPLSVELQGAWGLGALQPNGVERALAEIVANHASGELEPELSLDRATAGLHLAWSPPVPTAGRGLHGGPRALVGLEGRMLATGRLTEGDEGEPIDGLEGWTLVDEDTTLALGPVLGLGFSLSPTPRAALRLDVRDRMLLDGAGRPETLDAPGDGLRHDWTLALDVMLAIGGDR